jgi:hypothetical protein
MLQNIDETFRKNVESNVFSRKMLIELFLEKCWFDIFIEKYYNIFLKKLKHFVMHDLVEK